MDRFGYQSEGTSGHADKPWVQQLCLLVANSILKILPALMLFVTLSCADQDIGPSEEPQPTESTNRDKSNGARVNAGQYTLYDWSGQIESITIYQDVGNGQINAGYVQIPSGYVLVAGGAYITGYDAGAFLTECRPDFVGNRWYVASKSHIDSDAHILTCYAVGIKIQGVTPQTLRGVMSVSQVTSSSASHPATNVNVSSPYKLVGGGVKVNWSGWGNMLVYSKPSGQGWFVGSKDHIKSSPATITAWAIGMQDNIPGFGYIDIKTSMAGAYSSSGYAAAALYVNDTPEYLNLTAGAEDDYTTGGWGRMLMILSPDQNNSWATYSISKDHKHACGGWLYAYSIGIRKRP
jgi:hypothetical protein